MNNANDKRLFWACFIALIATAFGFVVRTQVMDDWARDFNLSETQKGEIFGVGLWPFGISIVLFSLVIDRIGYGRAAVFAFFCHVSSAIITILTPWFVQNWNADGYTVLYLGNFIVALGNGTVEAFINPIVATMFSREKTKWLNILHAGWPGGLVLGGILGIFLTGATFGLPISNWQLKVALLFIPVLLYAILMIGCTFPVSERVAAGVSYQEMLKEAGILGAALVTTLIVLELVRVFERTFDIPVSDPMKFGIIAVIVAAAGIYIRSLGRLMFFFLMIIMIPLAITELGTDSWITGLMEGEMTTMSLNPGWVLVYTSMIMLVLRFFAGPIVHKLSPLGLLAVSSVIAAVGLVSLSFSFGLLVLIAATIYGLGKTFFWPTMLGVVSEQFPKGGALTLNMISGVGMIGVGVIGNSMLGYWQDTRLGDVLRQDHPALYARVVVPEPRDSIFGEYRPVDETGAGLDAEETKTLQEVRNGVRKNVLLTVAIFPVFMFVCYMILILYFRAKGGYRAEVLTGHAAEDEKFTGGVAGPVEA